MSKRLALLLIAILAVSSLIMVESAFAQSITKPSVPEFTVKLVKHSYDVPTTYSIDKYTGENVTHPGYRVENKTMEISIKNPPTFYGENYTLYYNVRVKGHFDFENSWVELYYYSDSSSGNLPPKTDSQYTVLSFPADYSPNAQVDFQVEAVLVHSYERRAYSDDWLAQHPLAEVMQPGLKDLYVREFDIAGTSDWSDTQTLTIPAPVTLLMPQNGNFDTSNVPLDFVVDNQTSQFKYSLDGGENVPVTGNTTLTGLANGYHNVTVYAVDEFGNTIVSETVYFSVDVPFPTTLVVASAITVVVIGIGLLSYYFKKRKKSGGRSMSKKITLVLIAAILLCIESLPIGFSQTSINAPASAPAIEWQKIYVHAGVYDNTGIVSASNLIQTSDGGYVFMDLGWTYQMVFTPSTVYKVDSSGNLQWNKTIDFLAASTIIQTNDEGYEIAGSWTVGVTYQYTPTLVKMDSQGNIQWVANYSRVPNLGTTTSSRIRTSDGGSAYWTDGSIIKTDSNNNTQWVEILNGTDHSDSHGPLFIFSVIETSDGALAALGVGTYWSGNPRTGRIYLIKTEAFLPLPSQAPLPTPIPTSLPTISVEATIVVSLIIVVFAVAVLLIFLRKRKH
jgi:hypothetical protein